MRFTSRRLIKPGDLNANNTLFGGALLRWIDEEAGIYAMIKLGDQKVVTKFMSEINFQATAKQGDIIEIGLAVKSVGTTSITFECAIRNILTKKLILTIDSIVFVLINEEGRPTPHGLTYDTLPRNPDWLIFYNFIIQTESEVRNEILIEGILL